MVDLYVFEDMLKQLIIKDWNKRNRGVGQVLECYMCLG